MVAFLIVEDKQTTRELLTQLFRHDFPEAQIDAAGDYAEALAKVRALGSRGESYDVAVLDVRLPLDGSSPVDELTPRFREARRELLGALGNGTAVINYSATADSPVVQAYVAELRDPNGPKEILIHASAARPWPEEILREARRAVYGRRIREQIQQIHQAERIGAALPVGGVMARGLSTGTQGIGALLRDIKKHWHDLDPEVQRRVREVFDVREVGKDVLVNL
jgi:CheY-like chemotaxis protein